LAGFAKDNHARDLAVAAVGDHEIGTAQHLPHYVSDRAVETSRYGLFAKGRVPQLYIRGGIVQQASQNVTEWHAAHFGSDAEPIITEHKLVIRRNREVGKSTNQTNSTECAQKPAL
jgi:hypothetical protein